MLSRPLPTHHYVFRFFIRVCLASLLWPSVVAAAQFSLEEIPARVRSANPSLAAARWRVEEAKGRLLAAGRRANPEVGFEHQRGLQGRGFTNGWSLEQKFPLTARLRQEKEVTAAEVWQAEAETREVERALIAQAQEGAVKWLALRAQVALRKEQVTQAEEQAEFLRARAQQGESSALEEGQARLEAGQLQVETGQLVAEQRLLEGELRPLLGLPPEAPLSFTGELAHPESKPSADAVDVTRRPDYQALERAQEAAERRVELEKSRRWEDVTAGITAEFERSEDVPEGYENERFLGFRLSVPLPWWNKNEGSIHEAEARARRVAEEREALAKKIKAEAAGARAAMLEQARIAAQEAGALVKLAEEQLQRAQAAYEQGLASYADVMRARGQCLQARSAVLNARRDFHLARLRLETATARHVSAAPTLLEGPPSGRASTVKPSPRR